MIISTISSFYEILTKEAIHQWVSFHTSATLFPKFIIMQGISFTKLLVSWSSLNISPSISISKVLIIQSMSGQGSFKHSLKTALIKYCNKDSSSDTCSSRLIQDSIYISWSSLSADSLFSSSVSLSIKLSVLSFDRFQVVCFETKKS